MDLETFAANHIGERLKAGRILIIDDEPGVVSTLGKILKAAGFRYIESTTDPTQVSYLYLTFKPDVLILDLHMPKLDGLAVLKQLKALELDSFVPVLMLTGERSFSVKVQSLGAGARDFMEKPFPPLEAVARVRNLVEFSQNRRLRILENDRLEAEVLERSARHRQEQFEIIGRLSRAAEYRDDPSGQHVQRVVKLSRFLAEKCEESKLFAQLLGEASSLHDLGKIGISEAILGKPGELTAEERRAMQLHVPLGAQMLSGSDNDLLILAREIILSHHERWDGTGYPDGLAGQAIPLSGRIVALADSFDAMICRRPYKAALSLAEAAAEIKQNQGRQFDPALCEAFLVHLADIDQLISHFPNRG